MLTLGVGTSHSPAILLPTELWPLAYEAMRGDVAQPHTAAHETPETNAFVRARIDSDLARLRKVIADTAPDVLIIVGDDQSEVFGPAVNPTLAVFCGNEVSGPILPHFRDHPGVDQRVTLKCDGEFGAALAAGLVEMNFDAAVMTELVPMSRPDGIGHAFTRPAHFLGLSELGIPIVPVFLNCYHPPLPTAERCYQLGVAIRQIADARPERVAIMASGGLSHDPAGPRAGWIDRDLDNWVLEKIRDGNGHDLANLFTVDSQTFHGGTGEIRSWITVAGAFGTHPAEIIDYIPLHHAVTGLAFAYWRTPTESVAHH